MWLELQGETRFITNYNIFHIDIFCRGYLHVVFRQVLQDNTQVQVETQVKQQEVQPKLQATQEPEVQWHPVKTILRHQKRKGKDWYLVQWQENDEKSWVKRQDVSEAALKQFYDMHKPRKRRRHK